MPVCTVLSILSKIALSSATVARVPNNLIPLHARARRKRYREKYYVKRESRPEKRKREECQDPKKENEKNVKTRKKRLRNIV